MFKGVFEAQTVVPASREEVWNYFGDPVQLEEMTEFPEVEVESSGKTEAGAEIRLYLYFLSKYLAPMATLFKIQKPAALF